MRDPPLSSIRPSNQDSNEYSGISTKNQFDSEESFRSSQRSARGPNTLLEILLPLLFTWRLVGRFPYKMEGRNIANNLFSLWGLYSVLLIAILTAVDFMHADQTGIKSNTFNSKLLRAIFFIYSCCIAAMTIAVWIQLSRVAVFFQNWIYFEESLGKLGILLCYDKKKKLSKVLLVLSLIVGVVFAGIDGYVMQKFTYLPSSFMVHFNYLLIFCIWVQKNLAITNASNKLCEHFNSILSKTVVSREMVAYHRQLWRQLSHLYTSLGRHFGVVFLIVILLSSVTGLSAAYVLILFFKFGGTNALSLAWVTTFFVILLFAIFVAFSVSELAQYCTNVIGAQFERTILQQHLMKFDRDTEIELELFLKTISREYPRMVFGGYIQADRRLFLSILGASVTYLIVLVQFEASENGNSLVNESTILSIFSLV